MVAYLGKEVLLSWFTEVRSETHREVLDRLYDVGHPRVLFKTSIYPLVEVFTKIRYERSARATVAFHENLVGSIVRVYDGRDEWTTSAQNRSPRAVFRAVAELYQRRPKIEFSFPEAALVLGLARENRNRNVPVYLFTFDGTLATLADTFEIPVLPYSTPLRDDSGR